MEDQERLKILKDKKESCKLLKIEVQNFAQILKTLHSDTLVKMRMYIPTLVQTNRATKFEDIEKKAKLHEDWEETWEQLALAMNFPVEVEEIKQEDQSKILKKIEVI